MKKQLLAAVLGILSFVVYADEQVLVLSVPSMNCAACPITVKKSLMNTPGVIKAIVSLDNKTAVVTFDDMLTDDASIMQATTHAGYPSFAKKP